MTETRHRSSEDRQAEMRAAATAMGVDDAYISILVDTFYGRIRQDEALGPVFEAAIGDDWDPHLARMKDFWANVALGAHRYDGRPVPAHFQHRDKIEEAHFERWLGLFKATLSDTAPSPAAEDFFLTRAAMIAKSLKLALFGVPGLGAP